MRVALISDIHGNGVALEATVADIQKSSVDRTVCLGDAIQWGPQPKETIKLLRALASPIVMGNADAWLLDATATKEAPTAAQSEARAWTLSKLSEDDLAFIRSFVPTVDVEVGDGRHLLCFHGSPASYDDNLFPETPQEEWDRLLGPYSPAVMAGGNTHTQQVRRVGEGMFFNPGSVGVAYNRYHTGGEAGRELRAEYAILECRRRFLGVEFRSVEFDGEGLISAFDASGRPGAEQLADEYRKSMAASRGK